MPDESAIQGRWTPTKAELAGEAAPAEVLQHTQVEFAGGAYTVRFAGEVADAGDFALAQESGKRTMRLFCNEGPNRGREIPGIYQLHGDRLRICYGLAGTVPAAFSSAAGSRHYVVTYRRT